SATPRSCSAPPPTGRHASRNETPAGRRRSRSPARAKTHARDRAQAAREMSPASHREACSRGARTSLQARRLSPQAPAPAVRRALDAPANTNPPQAAASAAQMGGPARAAKSPAEKYQAGRVAAAPRLADCVPLFRPASATYRLLSPPWCPLRSGGILPYGALRFRHRPPVLSSARGAPGGENNEQMVG